MARGIGRPPPVYLTLNKLSYLYLICKSRIPLHLIISLVHIICQVSAQSCRAEIYRFHSTFEGLWCRWLVTDVSFRILSQTFRIKTGLHIQGTYARTFNISENDARSLLISYDNFTPFFLLFLQSHFFTIFFKTMASAVINTKYNLSNNGFHCYESQQIKTCWAKPHDICWQHEVKTVSEKFSSFVNTMARLP